MYKFDEIILNEIRERLKIPTDNTITLEFLNSIEYQQTIFSNVKAIFEKQDISAIKSLTSEGNGGTSDNLLIYLLKQKDGPDRLIIVLDKFDLWSNPSILDIF
ncbi:hypothetical protein [Pedobacter frigoris]|uniref:Uncharacterized protein n=1 Tax=Pedobacter frigoris TaxID=2571272 RepID=A0A4U1CP83_9SPHI|nr:hypothetical protein [Pedobacter frigoris]TKC09076.1 hypothetical protein FA047_02990 [Pedobacter frigoris]